MRAKSLQLCPTLCNPMDLQPTRLLCPWGCSGRNSGVGCHFLLQGIFPTQGSNLGLLSLPALAGGFFTASAKGYVILMKVKKKKWPSVAYYCYCCQFSCVRLCATPSLGFSRQEHWSGLPFPSPMHKSEKWKWSHSAMSNSSPPHGLQPTRLLRPWDFPGKSTGVGCHCFLQSVA